MGNIISENSLKSLSKSPKSKLNLGNKRRIKRIQRRSSISTAMTSTTTRSSESTYRYIDGRRFNENAKYALPNDDAEVDRLQLQHYLQRYVWQGNFCAPVRRSLTKPGARVLDVGCGPGTWILEMAFEFPDAHFTGIDISPMYPKEIKPSNVNFEEADLTDGLPFADDTFDFVVMRNMVNALSVDDWVFSLKELERVCKPGGFVECLEFQIPAVHLGKVSKRVTEAYVQIMRTKNIDITIAPRLEEMFATCTTLTNIEHQVRIAPVGKWGDKAGRIMAEDLLLITKAMGPVLTPLWGIGARQYEEFTNESAKEFENGKTYCNLHVIYAQKYEPYRYI
ncbi:unnamed protein product [Rhizophagus irregularis]|nr:unnamed protein product [Rhizophagus irregularis]